MSILTSWIFWLILGAIIIIMALIGYLAEGTDFANKALTKQPKPKKEPEEKPVPEIQPVENPQVNINENITAVPLEGSQDDDMTVVPVDRPIEVLNVGAQPDAWTDVIPKVDDRLETTYNVPSVDDWSVIPETNSFSNNELPEVKLDNLEQPEITEPQIDNDIFPDITPSDLEPTSEETNSNPFEQEVVTVPETNDTLTPELPTEIVPEEPVVEENKVAEDIWK